MISLLEPLPLSQSLLQHFDLVENNVQEIKSAQILLLGTQNANENQQKRISWLIETLYIPGDLILIDSAQQHPISCLETQFTATQLRLQGWRFEQHTAIKEAKNCLIQLLLHIDQVRSSGLTGKKWLGQIQKLFTMAPPVIIAGHENWQASYSAETLRQLRTGPGRLNRFNDIVNKLALIWKAYLDTLEVHPLPGAIQAHLPKTGRLFVIGKITQLTVNTKIYHDLASTQKAQLLHASLENRKYMILEPRTDEFDVSEAESRAALQKTSQGSLCCFIAKKAECCKVAIFACLAPLLCLAGIAVAATSFTCMKVCRCCKWLCTNSYRSSLQESSAQNLLLRLSTAAHHRNVLPRETCVVDSTLKPIEEV